MKLRSVDDVNNTTPKLRQKLFTSLPQVPSRTYVLFTEQFY